MIKPSWEWTEDDLQLLLGQPESARLEFKSVRLLEDMRKAGRDLAREASAFANSEGGTIVVGVEEAEEAKRKTRVARSIVGIDTTKVKAEALQQAIISNLSPLLNGLRVNRIVLAGEPKHKAVFVIWVPKGNTAYQCNHDCIYYGRSEFETHRLPDHEVRLRMMQGKLPSAELIWTCKYVDHGRFARSSYLFTFSLRNTGEVTIREFDVEICAKGEPSILENLGLLYKQIQTYSFPEPLFDSVEVLSERRVFPGQIIEIPYVDYHVYLEQNSTQTDNVMFEWSIFMDNSYARHGRINIIESIRDVQHGKQDLFTQKSEAE